MPIYPQHQHFPAKQYLSIVGAKIVKNKNSLIRIKQYASFLKITNAHRAFSFKSQWPYSMDINFPLYSQTHVFHALQLPWYFHTYIYSSLWVCGVCVPLSIRRNTHLFSDFLVYTVTEYTPPANICDSLRPNENRFLCTCVSSYTVSILEEKKNK